MIKNLYFIILSLVKFNIFCGEIKVTITKSRPLNNVVQYEEILVKPGHNKIRRAYRAAIINQDGNITGYMYSSHPSYPWINAKKLFNELKEQFNKQTNI